MPHFFFHLADGHRDIDGDGVDLPDIAAARVEAVRFAGELLSGEPEKLWAKRQWRVEVTDDRGVLLCTVIALAIDAPVRPPRSAPAKRNGAADGEIFA